MFKLNPRLTIEPNFNLSFTDFFYIKIKCCQYKGVFTATPYVTFFGKGSTVKNVCPLFCVTKTEIINLFRNYLFLPHIFIVHSFIHSFHSANGNFTIASCKKTLQCDKMIVNLKDSLTKYLESTFLQVRHFDYLDQSEIS